MSSSILSATKETDGYHIKVHLDTEKMRLTDDLSAGLLAGDPDPEWIYEWVWGLPQSGMHQQNGEDLSEEDYLKNILGMLPDMIAQEISRRTPPPNPIIVDSLHGLEIN